MPVKHVPQRTCVACRRVKPQKDLFRIVRTPEGSVQVAAGGKMSGRGAYLCASPECLEKGLEGGRLQHSLKTSLNQEDRERLMESIKALREIKEFD